MPDPLLSAASPWPSFRALTDALCNGSVVRVGASELRFTFERAEPRDP